MSETELHFGKLRKVVLTENQSIEDFCKEKLNEVGITELKSYHNDWIDALQCEFRDRYFIVKDIIFEAFDHVEVDPYDDIYDIKENQDGTYSFIMRFYNGGTHLGECIEEELEKLL